MEYNIQIVLGRSSLVNGWECIKVRGKKGLSITASVRLWPFNGKPQTLLNGLVPCFKSSRETLLPILCVENLESQHDPMATVLSHHHHVCSWVNLICLPYVVSQGTSDKTITVAQGTLLLDIGYINRCMPNFFFYISDWGIPSTLQLQLSHLYLEHYVNCLFITELQSLIATLGHFFIYM